MSEPHIGIKELRMLVEAERQMDRNEVPWVRVEGVPGRALMQPDIMETLGLTTGQTISWFLFGEILKLEHARIKELIATERTRELVAGVLGDEP